MFVESNIYSISCAFFVLANENKVQKKSQKGREKKGKPYD